MHIETHVLEHWRLQIYNPKLMHILPDRWIN